MTPLDKKIRDVDFNGIEAPPLITLDQIRRFEETPCWRHMAHMMLSDVINLRDDLELMGEGVDRNTISSVQAKIYAIKDILRTPSLMREVLEAEEKEKEQNEQE